MSFEITSMSYDSSRKVNRMNKITCYDNSVSPAVIKSQYSPVPYNIDISLYVLTKTQEDALQIVEQILPFFTPEFTLTLSGIPDLHVDLDVPIVSPRRSKNHRNTYIGSNDQNIFSKDSLNAYRNFCSIQNVPPYSYIRLVSFV